MAVSHPRDAFTIERHGEVIVFVASPDLEKIDFSLHRETANLLLKPIEAENCPLVVVDLTGVTYVGSMFLAILLKCFKFVESHGGMMALAGLSPQAKEILRVTSLSFYWPMYGTRQEAIEALESE